MTIDELRELTDFPFECFVQCDGPPNSILFAAPIPSPYGDGLRWHKTEESWAIDDDIELWENAWEQYIASLQPKRKNRTRKQAADQGAITDMPENLALITLKPYQNAMTPVDDKTAHLQPIMQSFAETLQQNYDTMLEPSEAEDIPFVQYYDKSPQAVSNLDLPTLRAIYSIFLDRAQKKMEERPDDLMKEATSPGYIKESITLYIPDFLKMIGLPQNHSKGSVDTVLSKIASYAAVYGVLKEKWGGREYKSHYPVLQLVKHDDKNNTVEVMSPYFHALIATILQASIEKTKQDKPKLKRNGKPFTLPTHSYMVKAEIVKERNRRAAEIVCVVVTLIELCGDGGTPHIKAKNIVKQCPDLKNALDAETTSSGKSRVLRRAFTKAWQLLETKTTLREHYKNIKFPDAIPTSSTLDMVIEFPHEGKVKDTEKP